MFGLLKSYTVYDKDGKVIIHTKDENLAFKLFDEKKKHYLQVSYDEPVVINTDDYHIV